MTLRTVVDRHASLAELSSGLRVRSVVRASAAARGWSAVGGLFVLGLFAVACSPDAAVETERAAPDAGASDDASTLPQGHIYTGITSEPDSLNPFTSVHAVTRRYVIPLTHDTLVDVDPTDGSPRGLLATSWAKVETSGGAPVFEFELRKDASFSDGQSLTPEDVLFTWVLYQAVPDPGTVVRGLDRVQGANLVTRDDGEVVLRLELKQSGDASVGILAALAVARSWVVVQRAQWLEWLGGESFDADAVQAVKLAGRGTGPYVCEDRPDGSPAWQPRRELLLTRSANNWHRKVRPGTWNLGGLRFLFDRQPSHAAGMLRRQELDWYAAGGLDSLLAVEAIAERYRKLTYSAPHLGHFAIHWNLAKPGLSDPRVRRALTMLFDRQVILDEFFGGGGSIATSFWPVASPEYPDRDPLPFKPEEAKRLLTEAGFGPGGESLEFEVLAPAGPAFYRQVLELGMDACRKVGVTLVPRILENNLLLDRRLRGEFGGVLTLTNHGPDPNPAFTYHSGDRGSANVGGYKNPEVDNILDALDAASPGEARNDLLLILDALTHADQPITYLLHPRVTILFNRAIQDAEPGPRGLWPETFWVPTEQQRR